MMMCRHVAFTFDLNNQLCPFRSRQVRLGPVSLTKVRGGKVPGVAKVRGGKVPGVEKVRGGKVPGVEEFQIGSGWKSSRG